MVLLLAILVLLLIAVMVKFARGYNHLLNFLDASMLDALLSSDESVLDEPVSGPVFEALSEESVVDSSVLGASFPEVPSPLFDRSVPDVPVSDESSVPESSLIGASLSDVFSGVDALLVLEASGSDDVSGSKTLSVLVASGLDEVSVGDWVLVGDGEAALVVPLLSLSRD